MGEKKFVIFWMHNDRQVIEGENQLEAVRNAGIGAGAVPAIDFICDFESKDDYYWNEASSKWELTKASKIKKGFPNV